MQAWMIILIVLAAVILLAVIIGAVAGKQSARRANSTQKPVLSKLQKVLCMVCMLVGIACVTTGLLLPAPEAAQGEINMEDGMAEGEDAQGGGTVNGGTGGGVIGGGGGVIISEGGGAVEIIG